MKIVSLITARGGSKSVPLKNIIDINGKPLIWYSINASLNSNVNETWVSTEDSKIKTVSIECGAKVIDRPKELADDIIMPDASILHFAENVDFDLVVFIQPTSPMIKPEYINEGIQKVIHKGYDSSFAVVQQLPLSKPAYGQLNLSLQTSSFLPQSLIGAHSLLQSHTCPSIGQQPLNPISLPFGLQYVSPLS